MPPADPAEPFEGSLAHLVAELALADGRLRQGIQRAQAALADAENTRALYVSEAEIAALLSRPFGQDLDAPEGRAEAEAAFQQIARGLDARADATERLGLPLRLALLRRRFGLDRFETDALLLALLPDVDPAAGRLFAYLQDDLTRRRPSVGATLSLLCPSFEARLARRARFTPEAPLVRHGLVRVFAEHPQVQPPLLSQAIKVEERIVAYLHGADVIDEALAPFARAAPPRPRDGGPALPAAPLGKLARFVAGATALAGPIVYLEGPPGAGQAAIAEQLARDLGLGLLVLDGRRLAARPDDALAALLPLAGREARLLDAALFWDGADVLLDHAHPGARAAFLAALEAHPGLVILGGAAAFEPEGALAAARPFVRVALPAPDAAAQAELWAAALAGDRALAADVDLDRLASLFRLNRGQIEAAAARARSLARLRDPDGAAIAQGDLLEACRREHRGGLGALARRTAPQHRWEDLVLPLEREEILREICAHARHRGRVLGAWGFARKLPLGKGLSALFSGPPGTGKTMAASVIAEELGLELYQVDLSTVVSKFIGETEKHLGRLFDEAEASRAILFFDEADALFGKRTEVRDAHDRYANLETSYLLQRVDAYEGVVILASNLARNMDEAFVRRLRFVVEFPLPGAAERRRIWQRLLPEELPLAGDVDLDLLAERFDLAGGHLRNIALRAAFLAAEAGEAVGMGHLLSAARREYLKMGKVVDQERFERLDRSRAAGRGARRS